MAGPIRGVFDTANVNFSIVPGQGFNSFRGPGVRDVDVSAARSFKLNERRELKFGIEAFDVFNHANFQQGAVDNVRFTTNERCTPQPDGSCSPLPIWDAKLNENFGKPQFAAPKYGSLRATCSYRCDSTSRTARGNRRLAPSVNGAQPVYHPSCN